MGSAKQFGYPAEMFINAGVHYVALDSLLPNAMADAMSSPRHIDKLNAPIVVTYGTLESPDFQRQSRDFAALVKTAGKPVQLIEAPNYHHFEMVESAQALM